MRNWPNQDHVKHYCRYHIVFVSKYRKKAFYGVLRRDIGKTFRDLYRQAGIEQVEGYVMKDHLYVLLMTPPKFSVAQKVGFLEGKSAIRIFRDYQQVT